MIETILKQANFYLAKLYLQNSLVPLDKFMHILSAAIGTVIIYQFYKYVFPLIFGFHIERIATISVLTMSAFGILKEVYDHYNPEKHTCDVWDWVATSFGGVFGAVLIYQGNTLWH